MRHGLQTVLPPTGSLDEGRLGETPGHHPLFTAYECLPQLILPEGGTGALNVAVLDVDSLAAMSCHWGRLAIDELLHKMAQRLKSIAAEHGSCGRMQRVGDDEFVLVAHQKSDPLVWGREVHTKVSGRYRLSAQEVSVSVTLGVSDGLCLGGDRHGFAEGLLKRASVAMRRGKSDMRGGVTLFQQSMLRETARRNLLETLLGSALDGGTGLSMVYQPCVRVNKDGDVEPRYEVEALLRWDAPGLGSLSPDEFIPFAEQSVLICRVGEFVVRRACADFRMLQDAAFPPSRFAINVSSRQLEDSAFPDLVLGCLEEHGLHPSMLQIELTEGRALRGARATAALERLRAHAITVAIDDFGFGYSSIAALHDMPADAVKIDRSFVRGLPESGKDLAVIESILGLARAFNLRVIAEGIETMDQYHCLRDMGCDCFQGYFFAKPMTVSQALRFEGFHIG